MDDDDFDDSIGCNLPEQQKHVHIERIAMSKEDELFYTIKYGHPPKFRIEKKMNTDDNGLPETKFYLTNIPRPGDIDD